MRTWVGSGCVLAGMLLMGCGVMSAQEIVHALSGTVVTVDSSAKTILLKTDDGSEGLFKLPSNPDMPLQFNAEVKAQTVPAGQFTKENTPVLLYFIGNGDVRTAVAVQELGGSTLLKTGGVVSRMDKHDHQLIVKTASGTSATVTITPRTVAETPDGVMEAERFDPKKGDNVTMVAMQAAGLETALFVREH